ncbi:MAG: cellulase family glycosylhydrolase [Polyangia bacterium]
MPKIHRDHAEWTPTRMLRWAETVGPKTAELVAAIIEEKPHPEHGYRACLGILRLGRRYGEPRLEAASARAVIVRSRTVLSVESILKRGLDRQGPVDATVIGRDAGVARRVSRRPQIPGSRRAAGGRADAHQGLEGRPDQVAAMAAPTYTIDATWMAQVVQTAQWAMDAGLYAFVNTHHEADGNGGWVTFPADPTPVVAEVTAVWTQIATAFLAFDSHLMLECFNEPNEGGGGATTQAMTDLNQYLVACVNAIRGTGGANATRVIMIQGIGASPSQTGINSVLNISVIDDPNLIFSVHTYYPTNFGLSTTPYAWGSASDYTSMSSSVTQLLSWLPGWGVVIGEWGSESAQATANRVLHAHVYSRDTAAAGMCSMWWDNGGSYAIFNRTTGAETYPTIVNALVTGAQAGLASPGTYATLASP